MFDEVVDYYEQGKKEAATLFEEGISLFLSPQDIVDYANGFKDYLDEYLGYKEGEK